MYISSTFIHHCRWCPENNIITCVIEFGSRFCSSPATHPSVEAVTTATRPSSFLPPAVDMDRTKEKQTLVLKVLSKDVIMLFAG